LKRHFGACAAARAAAGDADGARQLAAASAHWLRHTHARHLLANGLPLALAQQHLGHAARSTTAAYLVSERPPAREDWQAAWDATMAAQRGRAPDPGAEADPFTDEPPDR
jgi:integrase